MKKSELRQIVREEIGKVVNENQLQPSKPSRPSPEPDVMEPGTKEPVKPKRRTLAPPTEAPDTKPKASMKENEKQIADKIAQRFKKLSK